MSKTCSFVLNILKLKFKNYFVFRTSSLYFTFSFAKNQLFGTEEGGSIIARDYDRPGEKN